MHEITEAIEEYICPQLIKFPTTRREINEEKEIFMHRGVVGVVDGSHIAILKPKEEEHNFINRKGYHSLNVQIISNSNLKITSVNANFPGSSHDAFVWRNTNIREYLQNRYFDNTLRNGWLIADSGYPLEPFLMTPIHNPAPGTP